MSRLPPSPPPLSGYVPARICSRDMDWPNGVACGKEPFLHCCWLVDAEGVDAGFVCEEHARELTRRNWIPVQAHSMMSECGMPGAHWDFEENCCFIPEQSELVIRELVRVVGGSADRQSE